MRKTELHDDAMKSELYEEPDGRHTVFAHAGDYGDIIYGLAAMRQWSWTNNNAQVGVCLYPERFTTARMSVEHATGIIPLLRVQPYIAEAYWEQMVAVGAMNCSWGNFRSFFHTPRALREGKPTIYGAHFDAINISIPPNKGPWLGGL